MNYGEHLRKMRKGAGLSQDRLADKLHMSRSNVSRIESNKLKVTLDDAVKWAHETNAMDMFIALISNVDVASVAQMLLENLPTAGTIILGWCF